MDSSLDTGDYNGDFAQQDIILQQDDILQQDTIIQQDSILQQDVILQQDAVLQEGIYLPPQYDSGQQDNISQGIAFSQLEESSQQGSVAQQQGNQGIYPVQQQNQGFYSMQQENQVNLYQQQVNQGSYPPQQGNQGNFLQRQGNQSPYHPQQGNQSPYPPQQGNQSPYPPQQGNQSLYRPQQPEKMGQYIPQQPGKMGQYTQQQHSSSMGNLSQGPMGAPPQHGVVPLGGYGPRQGYVVGYPQQPGNMGGYHQHASSPSPYYSGATYPPDPPPNSGAWRSSIFDGGKSLTTFCIGLWCPCVLIGQVVEIVDRGNTSCFAAGAIWSFIQAYTLCGALYTFSYRRRLRAKFGLPESPLPDILTELLLQNCSACQMHYELKSRGCDPALGYQGVKHIYDQPHQPQPHQPPPQQQMVH